MVRILLLLFTLPLVLFSQSTPNEVKQIQPYNLIKLLKVKKRIGIEYEYTDSTTYNHIPYTEGDTQSISTFKDGQLVKKINHWNYSTAGDLIQSYEYDDRSLMLSKNERVGDSLIQHDEFVYSPGGKLLDWNITQGKRRFNQYYQYNPQGLPTSITVKEQNTIVRKDSICYEFDNQKRPIREWSYSSDGKVSDSLLYSYGEDTLHRKILLIDKKLSFIYYKIKFGSYIFDRIEEYTEGYFMGVYSRMYDPKGNLLKERNIHHYTNLNYTKNYLYNKDGLLIEKQIFKDTYQPTHIVRYSYEYY